MIYWKAGTAALVAAGMAGSASAITITIDDFDTDPPNPFVESLSDVGTVQDGPEDYTLDGVNTLNREILFDVFEDDGISAQTADIAVLDGFFSVTNGAGFNSMVTVTYDITALFDELTGASPNGSAGFNVLFADLAGINVTATLNGTEIGSATSQGTITTPTPISFGFSTGQLNGTNDILEFVATGPIGYDFTITAITATVPEPGVLGLLGLGVLGLGFAARRRRGA